MTPHNQARTSAAEHLIRKGRRPKERHDGRTTVTAETQTAVKKPASKHLSRREENAEAERLVLGTE